jgi:hypothetical protein
VETAKGTAEEVKPSLVGVVDALKDAVESIKPSIVGAANSVTEGLNHSFQGVADALKDTVEELKTSVVGIGDTVKGTDEEVNSSVISVEDTPKTTVEEVNPSRVGRVNSAAERVNHSFTGEGYVQKNIVEEVTPSVIGVESTDKTTAEEVNLSDNHKTKLYDEPLGRVPMRTASQKHPLTREINDQTYQTLKPLKQSENFQEKNPTLINYNNLQEKQEQLASNLQETVPKGKQQIIQRVNKKI